MNHFCLLAIVWACATPVFSKTLFFQNDTVPPVVVCPMNDTVSIAPGLCLAPYLYNVVVSDDQPGVTLTQTFGLPSGADFPLGVTVNHFVATDTAGNTAGCSFLVRITRPFYTLFCEEYVEVHLDAVDCSYTIEPDILVGPDGNCPSAFSLHISGDPGPTHANAFDQSDINTTFYVYILDTMSISVPSCVTFVKILGAEPTISCTDLDIPCVVPYELRSAALLRDSVGMADAYPTIFDACGDTLVLSFIEANQFGGCAFDAYESIIRTWTVTDDEGYSSSCVQNIRFNKVGLEDIEFPEHEVLNLDCSIDWDSSFFNSKAFYEFQNRQYFIEQSSCHLGAISMDTVVEPCAGGRVVWRTFTVLDWCLGEVLQDTQQLTLFAGYGPLFACDSVMVVQTDAPDCTVELSWPSIEVSSRCSYTTGFAAWWNNGTDTLYYPAELVFGTDTLAQWNPTVDFPAGQTLVTFEATDACGMVYSCQTQVQIWDNVPPALSCDSIATVYLPFEQTIDVLPGQLPLVVSDACAQLFYKIQRDETTTCDTAQVWTDALTTCCSESGDTISVQIRVYDVPTAGGIIDNAFGGGQSATCSLRLAVVDTVSLRCIAPSDTVVVCFDLLSDVDLYGGNSYPCSVDSMTYMVDVTAYDSVCRRGDVVKKWQVFNALGQTSACQQTITVTGIDRQFAVRFPDDRVTFGCAIAANTAVMGEPIVLDNGCGLLEISYVDTTSITSIACLQVNRIWTVTDGCFLQSDLPLVQVPNPEPNPNILHNDNQAGPTVSAPGSAAPWTSTLVKIFPPQTTPTDYSVFWSDSIGGFTYTQRIRIIDNEDPVTINCPVDTLRFKDSTTNDALLWNDSIWGGSQNLYDKSEVAGKLEQSGTDFCIYNKLNLFSRIYLDLDGNGSMETVVSSAHPLPPGQVRFDNNGTMQFGGGTLASFDDRALPDSLKYRFVLKVSLDSATRIVTGRWYWQSGNDLMDPILPQGKHRVWWNVEDDCGNEAICNTFFSLEDGFAPVLACLDTVDVFVGPDGLGTLAAGSLLAGTPVDNLTPSNLIELGLNKGTSILFPLDAAGQPIDSLVFGCYDSTLQTVQLWARDANGNASSCTSVVRVDPTVHCFLQPFQLGGRVKTYGNRTVAGVVTTVDAGDPLTDILAPASDQDGEYAAGLPSSGVNFTLIPAKPDAAINGISTFDLVLINGHILNIMSFDTPYKIIAADANNSKTVTTADIALLRRLILGIQDTLPGLRSWVFVDSVYVFPNPDNPFTPVYPTSITAINPPGNQLWHHFVGVKIGDVNDNADVDSLVQQTVEDRKPLPFILQDRYVETNEIFYLHLAPQTDVTACQFTLNYPGLECLGITPDAGLTAEHAAVFAEKNKITVSNDVGGKTGFNLHVRALKNGFLSEKLNITSDITPAEAWSASGEKLLPQLVFRKNEATASLTAQPTVFSDQTVLIYTLPTETKATLLVYNAAGQLLFQQTVSGAAGEHQFVLNAAMVKNSTGQMMVQLRTGRETLVVKVVKQ